MIPNPTQLVERTNDQVQTEVTNFDRANNGLSAGVTITGVLSAFLICYWYCTRTVERFDIPILPVAFNSEEAVKGVAEEIETPGELENPEIQTPALPDALKALEVFSTVEAYESDLASDQNELGTGTGKGDKRNDGEDEDGDPNFRIKPWEKWDIQNQISTIDQYAKQLDFFQVEIGAVERNGANIWYGKNFTGSKPTLRKNEKYAEKRIYFISSKGQIRFMENRLMNTAGLPRKTLVVTVLFYPKKMIAEMLEAEKTELDRAGRKHQDIEKTTFRIFKSTTGYQMKLEAIKFKPAGNGKE